jgi:hypothetical protein
MNTSQTNNDLPLLLTRSETMKLLRINSVNTLYKLLGEGGLKELVISGGKRVFLSKDIMDYLAKLKNINNG